MLQRLERGERHDVLVGALVVGGGLLVVLGCLALLLRRGK